MSRTRRPTILNFCLICTIALGSAVLSTGAQPAEEPEIRDTKGANPLTVSDVINLEMAHSFDISPDGRWAVWVKVTSDKKKNRRRQSLFLSGLQDTHTVQLTRASQNDFSPRFSPDGLQIAFLRQLDKDGRQIHIMDIRGGEPEKLTSIKSGIRRFAWQDGGTILYTAREDSTFRENSMKKQKDDVVIVADQEHYPPVRLFRIDIDKKESERLTTNPGVINEFSVSPNGRWVVTNEIQDVNYEYDYRIPPKQFLIDLEQRERHEIFTAPHVDPYDFEWDSASEGFYCRRRIASDSTNTYVSISQLYYFALETQALSQVPLGWPKGLGGAYLIVKDGLVVSLADGVRSRIAYVSPSKGGYEKVFLSSSTGRAMRLYGTQRNASRIIYLASTASTIPEVITATIKDGKLHGERKLLNLNEDLKKKTLSRTEIIRWTGALNDTVEGILHYPAGYEEGGKYPLVAIIHGGPAGVDTDFFTERWSEYPHVLASKGSFTLNVNYHGSGNYGLEWVESIKGHYYEYEVPDILHGIDHMISREQVDPEKIGIMGWSNGAILAIECCLQSDRFKALSAGAGDVNWVSDYGNCAFGAAFDNAYFGGPPWENLETYIRKSPLFRMKEMTTPTLIMFGTKDTNVPTEQGWEHFRAMQQIGKTPVRFLLFPGATHGLSKLSHRRRKMEEELAWFDRYLFGTHKGKNEAFDENSLIALELKKASAKRRGHLLGDSEQMLLIPEVVELEGIRIGRFEVTRAQFNAFDPNYTLPPGTENHPVNGISFPLAQTYCMWLSEKTGRSFRLPTTNEMQKLLDVVESNLSKENNIDRWAGYQATPDELEMLQEKIEALEKTRLLIEPAGSCPPVGEGGIYDLGGNVAEWVVDADGKGTIMGLSAVSSRDTRTPYRRPPLRYVGFRICEEKPEP